MVFILHGDTPKFPDPLFAEKSGLLAIGGQISVPWLLEAYKNGIFPWYDQDSPVMWWSPDPRAVMKPSDIHIPHSMRPVLNQNKFQLKVDTAFEQVINYCAKIPRKNQDGTWIMPEIIENYTKLHHLGYAHSFEAWQNGKLVGGLYGVSLGRMFFGESMFSLVPNASKFAFISMAKILQNSGFNYIDCQIPNDHLKFLGCKLMSRKKFIHYVKINNSLPTLRGKWQIVNNKLALRKN